MCDREQDEATENTLPSSLCIAANIGATRLAEIIMHNMIYTNKTLAAPASIISRRNKHSRLAILTKSCKNIPSTRKRMDTSALKKELVELVEAANDMATLETVRVTALGKKGRITDLMKTLGAMSPDDRKTAGAELNLLKTKLQD